MKALSIRQPIAYLAGCLLGDAWLSHCRDFYSVAQHSVVVSRLVPKHLRKQALFHDAVEAVVGDMVSPLKRLIPEYKSLEKRCEAAILAGLACRRNWIRPSSKPTE